MPSGSGIFCYIWDMSEEKHIYQARTAKMIVDSAIMYGMPVPKVESMFDYAKKGAAEIVAKREFAEGKQRNSQFFSLLRKFFDAGLRKYSAKMPEYEKMEIREILTRNRENLIRGLTKIAKTEADGADGSVTNV